MVSLKAFSTKQTIMSFMRKVLIFKHITNCKQAVDNVIQSVIVMKVQQKLTANEWTTRRVIFLMKRLRILQRNLNVFIKFDKSRISWLFFGELWASRLCYEGKLLFWHNNPRTNPVVNTFAVVAVVAGQILG